MDRRPLDRVFFVYDHSVVQREEDDPKDAIAYFYPKFPIDTQCLLCGQLMGMVNFLKILCSSEPKIYKLRKMKVTTRHEGNFTLALAHDPKVSDMVAIEMVNNLYDVFCMYHGSFTRLLKNCQGNREVFSQQMSSIWNCYLPFIRDQGNSLKTIFHAVPTIELPKKCGWIFLKCSHLLQWLKRKPWLLAGCLLYKNKVLCTQLTSDLTARLILVKSAQKPFPAEKIKSNFDLPFGVRILSVYLRDEEYKLFAKQDSAKSIECLEDAMSEKATEMNQEGQQGEKTVAKERHPLTSPPEQQLQDRCNKDSSESDVSPRTSSSPECSDVSPLIEACDGDIDTGRCSDHHGNEGDISAEDSYIGAGGRAKCPSLDSGCIRNSYESKNGRHEHLCGDAKVNDVGHLETKAPIDISKNEEGSLDSLEGRNNQESRDIHKSNHEHNTQGATSIAFNTKEDQVNGIIDHPKDICGHPAQNFSSYNSNAPSSLSKDRRMELADGIAVESSLNNASCLKTAEKDPSGVVGTFCNAVISTAVSELRTDGIDNVLLPKVEVNYDGENLEDEPFEIHINPLDSESSPEHSDSSGIARADIDSVMPGQRPGPVADDNGNILLQNDTGHLGNMDAVCDDSRQAVGHMNGAHGVTSSNIQDSATLSKNNSHSRDSLSRELTPAMQQLSQRTSGEHQPPSSTSFSHSHTAQHIPQATEPNAIQAKHKGNTDSSSILEYSTPKTPLNQSRSEASYVSATSSRQHDQTHQGTNSEPSPDTSEQAEQSSSFTNQSTSAGHVTSPVSGEEKKDLRRNFVHSESLEESPQSPTGGLVRTDGTRRRGWTRSRSTVGVTSPSSGNRKVSHERSSEEVTKVKGMVNVSLYVQAHSDTMLLFLGDKDWMRDKSRLLNMWQSLVIKLAELELELQQVLDDKLSNQEQDQIYNFLQFSPFDKAIKTNTTGDITTQNREFVNVVDTMREMFVSNENISHLTVRGQHSTVIGSQNDSYQTYFQPLRAQPNNATTALSSSSSSSSSSPSSSASPMMQATSAMATRQGKLEALAEKVLLRDHDIRFL